FVVPAATSARVSLRVTFRSAPRCRSRARSPPPKIASNPPRFPKSRMKMLSASDRSNGVKPNPPPPAPPPPPPPRAQTRPAPPPLPLPDALPSFRGPSGDLGQGELEGHLQVRATVPVASALAAAEDRIEPAQVPEVAHEDVERLGQVERREAEPAPAGPPRPPPSAGLPRPARARPAARVPPP